MPDPQQKLVQVNGLGVIAFPTSMPEERIAEHISALKKRGLGTREKAVPTVGALRAQAQARFGASMTEESEHARQLKPAQPLGTVFPKLPAWMTRPLVSDKDLQETPEAAAETARSQAAFKAQHPKIAGAFEAGDNPITLGALEGVENFTRSMTSPAGIGLAVAAPESKLLSALFTVQALRGSYKDVNAARQAYLEGNNREAAQLATQALLGAGVAAAAGTHAASELSLPEPAGKLLQSETGSVGSPLAPKQIQPPAPSPIERIKDEQPAGITPKPEPRQAPPEQPKTGPGGKERRADVEKRKRVAEMSPEELRRTLLTSDKTGLPNRRSFDEAEYEAPAKATAMSDADGLKAFNDRFGYDAGDELLKAKAEALTQAGLEAYHEKGDEFLYRGESPEDLNAKLDKAREILRNRVIRVTMDDGQVKFYKGADFSYGTGTDLKTAKSGLRTHKSEREARGERARGELRGITEAEPEKGEEDRGAAGGEPNP